MEAACQNGRLDDSVLRPIETRRGRMAFLMKDAGAKARAQFIVDSLDDIQLEMRDRASEPPSVDLAGSR